MTAPAAAEGADKFVVFVLAGRRYALALGAVERVVRMVALAPLPRAPAIVLGLVDLQGEVVPVLDVRRRFRLPERAPRASDPLIVARTRRRRVGLVVESVEAVIERAAAERIAPETVAPGLDYVQGVTRLEPHGLVLIHDLDTFLSLDEERALTAAEAR
jgi:purine-binding chemotaxis protein CheW